MTNAETSTAPMKLPAFGSTQEAWDFLDQLLVYRSSPRMRTAKLAFACTALVLWLIISSKEVYMYYKRRRWLFRLVHMPQGIIVVPSVNSVFVLFAITYVLLNGIMTILTLRSYDSDEPLTNWPFWIFLHFIPLYIASFWQMWSCAYGRVPGSHDYELYFGHKSHGTRLSPVVLNSLWIGTPILASIIVAIPTALAVPHFNTSVAGRALWIRECSGQAQLSAECLYHIQQIWDSLRRMSIYLALTCYLWFFFCIVDALAYAFVAARLLVRLKAHLAALVQLQQAQELTRTIRVEQVTKVELHELEPVAGPRRGQLLRRTASRLLPDDDAPEPPFHTSSSFVPMIDPVYARHERLGDGSGFRSVFRNFGVQSVIISFGAAIFGSVALITGCVIVPYTERNNIQHFHDNALLFLQVFTVIMACLLLMADTNLDASETFLTLMHGRYRAGGFDIVASPTRTDRGDDLGPFEEGTRATEEADSERDRTEPALWQVGSSHGPPSRAETCTYDSDKCVEE